MKRTHNLHFDKIVIGADLSALSFSYVHKIPFIYVNAKKPLFNEVLKQKILGIDNSLLLWERLATHLGLCGLDPFGKEITGISILNSGNLMLGTEGISTYHISFNRVFVSDDDSINGLPEVITENKKLYEVIDFFRGNCIPEISHNENDDFFYHVRNYAEGNTGYIIAYSKLLEEELESPYFNENIARIKMKRVLKSLELKIPNIEYNKRQSRIITKTTYKEEETIKFIYESPEDIFNNNIIQEDYSNKLLKGILDDAKISETYCWYYNRFRNQG